MIRVAGYLRVSTSLQITENQLPAIRDWCKTKGYELVEVYQENESAWRNGLSLTFYRKVPNVITRDSRKMTDWYHIQVRNNHRTKYARNCVPYLLKIKNLNTGEEIYPPNLELVWSGTFSFTKHILPQRAAEVDAFLIFHDSNVISFKHAESSSTQYSIPDLPAGSYLMTYTVICENFDQVSQTFRLDFGGNHNTISFIPHNGGTSGE